MTNDSEANVTGGLLQRLQRLEADNAQLKAELRSLHRGDTSPSTPAASANPDQDRGGRRDEALTRRATLVRLAGAAAAGVGAAAGASVLSASPAAATHAGHLQVGHFQDVGNEQTGLVSSSDSPTFAVVNNGTGHGLYVHSFSRIGVVASGVRAPLRLLPHTTVGPPATGDHVRGEVMLDSTGAMFVCRSNGTPGTWTRAGFNGVTPTRIADTRAGTGTPYSTGPIGPGSTREITVAEVAGVPAEVGGVVMNATAVAPSAASYITVYPSGVARPVASNLNVVAGGPPTPNLVITKLGTDGKVRVFNAFGSVHIVLDVAGFFS